MEEWADQRRRLVEELRAEGIKDDRVLALIGRVPREQFLPASQRDLAYRNSALPIGQGQTISQPFVVALMTQELDLSGVERVLEIGTGSGYQTAILAEMSRHVVTVERHPPLLERAREILTSLGYRNVELHLTNGSLGWPAGAPYDRIIVTAAAPDVPEPLMDQLAADGRLVIPVGSASQQELLLVKRKGGQTERRKLGPVRFVPLVGKEGWE
ncbi:MAG TPA: protein-L-isoaspartate(D-aspartate) O-methyltransferase [Chloroflexota bacterium]|nr:protein-L-isoaspartate(D-aspartate) O-methyltransferase [Chloroflexota bacterium]